MARRRHSNTATPPNSNDETTKKAVNRENLKEFLGIFRYVWKYKTPFYIGLFFLVLSTTTSLLFPYLASMLVDASTASEGMPYSVNQIGLFLVGILVAQAIFSYARIVLFANVSERAMADIRQDLYNKLISLPLPFFEERRVGELTSRMTADVAQLQNAISINLAEFFRQIATLLIGIMVIAYTSIKLTLVMLLSFPVAIIATMFFGRFIRKLSRKTQDALAATNVVTEETLQSIQVVKAFTNENFESLRYGKGIGEVVRLALKTAHYRGLFVSFLITAVFGGMVLVLWVGFSMVQAGSLTLGELIRFMLYTFFIGAATGGMGDLYSNLQKALGASERVTQIINTPSEVDLTKATRKVKITGDIAYNNIIFSYPTRKDITVLKNLNMQIAPGQKIALVGASGAGKSTIAQLLLRLYDIDSGEIMVDNNNIKNYDISALRANIGIVPQEVILFGGTISENISYGNPNATKEEIIAAAKQANALEFINSFPESLNTLVGERGVKLSGGQRQRIAIARAILKDPAILILDEATSSLDSKSEQLVQEALNKLMENRTTIIIAHRLTTIRKVDTIYVLDDGQIIEQGTHEELSAVEDGTYQNLLRLQFQEV